MTTPTEIDGQLVVGFNPLIVRGQDGRNGTDGQTPTIAVGSVSSGSPLSVTMTGQAPNYQLNFTIPSGTGGSGTAIDYQNVQSLTASQQQVAATNMGTVRIVEPEQYSGADDGAQFTAAYSDMLTSGGVIRTRPGKTYTWPNSIGPFDHATHGNQVVILAWGSTINYTGTGAAITCKQSSTATTIRTLSVYGGTWVASSGTDFFLMQDVNNSYFFRPRLTVPNGNGIHFSNVQFWSERNHVEEPDDGGCLSVTNMTVDGSSHTSFARCKVNHARLQAGTPTTSATSQAKINAANGTGWYDGECLGTSGNLTGGATAIRIAGDMGGTKITPPQIEQSGGTGNCNLFLVGTFTGSGPELIGTPVVHGTGTLYDPNSAGTPSSAPSFPANWHIQGVSSWGAIRFGQLSATISSGGGTASFFTANADVGVVNLSGNCTGTTMGGTPTTPSGLIGIQSQRFTLCYVQDGTGGRTYVWPTNCRFAGGTAPSDTSANTCTSVTFVWHSGSSLWREIGRAVAVPVI